jgi:hypothetical protein
LQDGSISFDGLGGAQVVQFGTISHAFSVQALLKQAPATSGYIFAKSDSIGSRFYSLYSSMSGSTYFYYRPVSVGAVMNVAWNASLADGNWHRVQLVVNGDQAELIVDSSSWGARSLAANVDDCGFASDYCILTVGKRVAPMTSGVFQMIGIIQDLTITFNGVPVTSGSVSPP